MGRGFAPGAGVPAGVVAGELDRLREAGELVRLRAEVADLRRQVRVRRRRRSGWLAVRRTVAAALACLAALGVAGSVVGVWAARTTVDTDRWVAAVAPLPRDPAVAAAVAQFATDSLAQVVDLEGRVRDALPPRAGFVVGPIADQLRGKLREAVDSVVRSDGFARFWVAANRQAHEQALAILRGNSAVVSSRGDHVYIDLLPLINMALRQLSAELPTLFGHQLSLPNLDSGAVPDHLRSTVESATGVTLPANFAQFTVYDAGRLHALQLGLVRVRRGLGVLLGGTAVLLVAAFAVSPWRRRTALQWGLWLVAWAVVVTAGLRSVRGQLLERVPAGTYRDGAGAALRIVTSSLRARGTELIWFGVLVAAVAYLVGPGRFPAWLRGRIGAGARVGWRHAVPAMSALPGFAGRHRDALRVAGVPVAALLAFTVSSWGGLLLLLGLLGAYEIAVSLAPRPSSEAPQSP
jgi:hypothetical protein